MRNYDENNWKNFMNKNEGLIPLSEEELATSSAVVVMQDVFVPSQNKELLPYVFEMHPQYCLSIIRPFPRTGHFINQG